MNTTDFRATKVAWDDRYMGLRIKRFDSVIEVLGPDGTVPYCFEGIHVAGPFKGRKQNVHRLLVLEEYERQINTH